MQNLKSAIEKAVPFILKNHIHWYLGIAVLFLLNHRYVMYPDEFSNLLGGKLILQGVVPYKELFDHHMPGGWYIGSLLLILSGGSFSIFRFVWALSSFGLLLSVVLFIKKHYKEYYFPSLAILVVYPLLAVYFWFHLFLADSVAGLLFVAVFMLLIVQTLSKKVHRRSLYISSFLIFLIPFTSLTYIFLAAALYLWQLILFFSSKKTIREIMIYAGIGIAPYLMYVVYLLISGSLKDFYIANIVYNTDHYISIPNYEKGRFFNPIKFALTLVYNFSGKYIVLLSQIKTFDIFFPMGVFSALGSLSLFILLLKRNWFVAVAYFFVLSFSAPRSDITKLSETDYQMTLFLLVGLVSGFFALSLLREVKTKEQLLHDLSRVTAVILAIFGIFSFIFLLNNSFSKYYQRYTQKMPSIVNYSHTADFIDEILLDGEHYWTGPFQPDHQFFVDNPRLPGKYFYLMPQFRESETFSQDFLNQFKENPPKIVIVDGQASIFMTPVQEFGAFFIDWLETEYILLKNEDVELIKSPSTFDFKSDMYILRSEKDEILGRLREKGYIK